MRRPLELLTIQVLDDSTDLDTRAILLQICGEVRARTGVNCLWIHRPNRAGYKAGALEHGRKDTDAEFIAIFDADFVPPPGYLEHVLPHFYDRDRASPWPGFPWHSRSRQRSAMAVVQTT